MTVEAPVVVRPSTGSLVGDAPASARRERLRTLVLGPAVPVATGAAVFAVCMTLSLRDYYAYRSGAYDLGFFDQVVERTAQGHPFQTSFLDYSFLGQHFEPVLALWAPLDLVAATPIWLLLVQALALSLAPVAAWRLARAWLGRGCAAPLAALACLLDPLVLRGAAFDYHSEALTPVLALLVLDGSARGSRRRMWLPALALVLVKEDAILVAAGAGWIAWRADGRRDGAVLCASMLATFAVVVGVVMPGFRGGARGDLAVLYAYLGGATPAEMLRGAVLHPDRWLGRLLSPAAGRGLAAALLPLGGLPLLAGSAALALIPILLVALLAASPAQEALLFHYGLEAFPLLLACALLGWRRVRSLPAARSGRPTRLTLAVAPGLAVALVAGFVVGGPIPPALHADAGTIDGATRRDGVEAVLARVPAGAAVSASTGLVPHLSARTQVYEFPDRAFDEPWVVLDSRGPHASWALDAGYQRAAAALPSRGYHVVTSSGGVTLWQR